MCVLGCFRLDYPTYHEQSEYLLIIYVIPRLASNGKIFTSPQLEQKKEIIFIFKKRNYFYLSLLGIQCCTTINLRQMSYLHMFRRKPASTRSDWHFTASQNSSENYATFTRSIHYNLVLGRSPSFGSNRSNLPTTFPNK